MSFKIRKIWEGGSGLGTYVHPWRIHVNAWQNQYSIVKRNKVKINLKRKETDLEQRTGAKLGKKYAKIVYCHSAYLTSMQSTSLEMLGWMKHKLESRLSGEISITSDMQMIPL